MTIAQGAAFAWESAILQGGSFALLAWLVYWWTTKYQPAQQAAQAARDDGMRADFMAALKAQQKTFTSALERIEERHQADHQELRAAIADMARAQTQRIRTPTGDSR